MGRGGGVLQLQTKSALYFHFPIRISYWRSFKFSYPSTLLIALSTTFIRIFKSKWKKLLKNLCRMQLSPTVATSASTPAPQLLTSRSTCGNIREKSLSSAINVNTHAHMLTGSRHICGNICEKSLSSAINVATLAQKLVASGDTC